MRVANGFGVECRAGLWQAQDGQGTLIPRLGLRKKNPAAINRRGPERVDHSAVREGVPQCSLVHSRLSGR